MRVAAPDSYAPRVSGCSRGRADSCEPSEGRNDVASNQRKAPIGTDRPPGARRSRPAAASPSRRRPSAKGIESEGYEWNEMMGEKMEALDLTGDLENGEEAYEICSACHLPSGAGRPDGTFPQLAGQHRTVIIKQIADIREGRRDNPIMYPFAKTLTDSQELADVSAYIQTLPIPHDNGKGPGTNLERGKSSTSATA